MTRLADRYEGFALGVVQRNLLCIYLTWSTLSVYLYFIPPNSEDSAHGDFGDGYNLIEIVSVSLGDITRVMIHRIQDPSVPLEYLSGWEPIRMERLMVRTTS